MLHIPPTNLLLQAVKQESYKKAYLFMKNIEEFSGKSSEEWASMQTERATGLGRQTRKEIVKWNQMTALRFQIRGRHQTSPASLWGLQKVKSGIGGPDWDMTMFDSYFQTLLCIHCSGHARVKGNNWANRLAGKAIVPSSLRLGRSKVLGSLRHYLWAQSRRHHTIHRLDERGMKRGSA